LTEQTAKITKNASDPIHYDGDQQIESICGIATPPTPSHGQTSAFLSTPAMLPDIPFITQAPVPSTILPSTPLTSLAPTPASTSSVTPATTSTSTPSVTPATTLRHSVSQAVSECITYCKEQNVYDPTEILRCAQKFLVKGKPLNGFRGRSIDDERTNFILINRQNVLGTAMEEIPCIEDVQLTLEVSFYGENAQDAGGPRKEFFRLCLQEIKKTYFDNGLKEHLSEDYQIIGLIMALSVLQNGKMPRFLDEDQLQAVLGDGKTSSKCLTNLSQGLNKLGLGEIAKNLPMFLHLFRPPSCGSLTRRKLVHLLKPEFSEDGCNQRQHENIVYTAFSTYCREAAGGKRGNVTLEHILQFTTATDEEPVLGFADEPSIHFVPSASSAKWSFIPTANTCANTLYLPCPGHDVSLPVENMLFEVYDMAFSNAYFGNA
jgi:hypothetical protein